MDGKLADRIRVQLHRRGWQQSDLARNAGISEATISRLLAGQQQNPTTITLNAIANALNVPIDDLLDKPASRTSGDELEASLIDLYRQLDQRRRQSLVEFAESLLLRQYVVRGETPQGRAFSRIRRMIEATESRTP